MNRIGYLGFAVSHGSTSSIGSVPPHIADENHVDFSAVKDGLHLSVRADSRHTDSVVLGNMALFLRGYALRPGSKQKATADEIAQEINKSNAEKKDYPFLNYEGSFSLVIADADIGQVVIYRNMVGTEFTYYGHHGNKFFFGSNLAQVVSVMDQPPAPNQQMLPALFLFRYVPGRETLFNGIYRLMPGEILIFDRSGLRLRQVQTLESLMFQHPLSGDPVDLIDDVLGTVVGDCARFNPKTVNLLSGGVDSSYLQLLWNRALDSYGSHQDPGSISICLDHPKTQMDSEYALSAARMLKVNHQIVTVDAPYHVYLWDTINKTAELPNHVQGAYFGLLARALAQQNVSTGLCGEASDGLFCMNSANQIHNAQLLKSMLPFKALCRLGARMFGAIGQEQINFYFNLASDIGNIEDLRHPVNLQAAYTHWSSVEKTFGIEAVKSASAYRRALLKQYGVPNNPMIQLHAVNFLTSSMDTASLWTTIFNAEGLDLICPFLDSRVIQLAVNLKPRDRFPFRKPKELVKKALARSAARELAYRKKRGFGQPIFEWMEPRGKLRGMIEQIGMYDFIEKEVLADALRTPNWFLFTLLCYDLWHKRFIEGRSVSVDEM